MISIAELYERSRSMSKFKNESDLPDYEIETLARAFLPLILKHFGKAQDSDSNQAESEDISQKAS